MFDEVRGSSKIEVYVKYVDLIDGYGGTFQSHEPEPKYKKECKRQMEQDPHTGEWLLRYHLHT